MVTTRSETIQWRHKASIAVACSLFEGLFNGGVSCLLDLDGIIIQGKGGRKKRKEKEEEEEESLLDESTRFEQ